jgi:hypothetical protein
VTNPFFEWRLALILSLAAMLSACQPAAAAPTLPLKGTYQCFTTSWMQTGPAPNPRDMDERKKRGMNPLEPGEFAMNIPAPMGMMLMPAVFGEIEIDGKGGYALKQMKQTGKYTFDAKQNDLRFTGDLGAMVAREFNPQTSGFVLTYEEELAFQCGRVGAPASGTQAAAIAAPPPPVANFNGVFTGEFTCNGVAAPLNLELTPGEFGEIAAAITLGGGSTTSAYTAVGNFSAAKFYVVPDFGSILSQSGLGGSVGSNALQASFSGEISGDEIVGKVDNPGCTTFRAKRQ